jgi:hypothetical protein
VSAYYPNGDSVIAAQRVFRRYYEIPPRGQVPSAHAIRTWVRNFEETGSDLKKKPSGRVLSVRIPENIDSVPAAVVRSHWDSDVGACKEYSITFNFILTSFRLFKN